MPAKNSLADMMKDPRGIFRETIGSRPAPGLAVRILRYNLTGLSDPGQAARDLPIFGRCFDGRIGQPTMRRAGMNHAPLASTMVFGKAVAFRRSVLYE
jgi:hypothetical protein